MPSKVGVELSWVTRWRRISSRSANGSPRLDEEGMSTVLPWHKGHQVGIREPSKAREYKCRNTSAPVDPTSARAQLVRSTIWRCSIITPFGCPVEPEV